MNDDFFPGKPWSGKKNKFDHRCWREVSNHQVLPSGLFGGFKWPFQGLSDFHLRDQKVNWKKLADSISGSTHTERELFVLPMLDFCSLQLLLFLPIIIEVENGCIWKVASTGGTHFYLPWLWEKEYLPWSPSSLFAFGRPKRRQVKHHFEQQILWLSVRYQTTKSPLRPSKTFKYSIWNQDFAINKHGIILTIYSPFSESPNDVQQLCYETSSNFGGCCFICPCRILEANSVRLWTNMGSRACKAMLRLIWSKSSAMRRKVTMCWRFISWHSSMPAKPQVNSG